MKPNPQMTVKELLDRYPTALDFFIQRKMLCAGCPAEALHTLEDVSQAYHIPVNDLIKAIHEAIPQNP
jgi:hybrid cluster-associated redox disulfide protein